VISTVLQTHHAAHHGFVVLCESSNEPEPPDTNKAEQNGCRQDFSTYVDENGMIKQREK